MRLSTVLAIAILAGTGVSAAAEPTPVERAQANYEAILRGEKRLYNLTPEQQQEIRELDRRRRAQAPEQRDPFEDCRQEEYAKLGRAPSDLDKRVIDTRCR